MVHFKHNNSNKSMHWMNFFVAIWVFVQFIYIFSGGTGFYQQLSLDLACPITVITLFPQCTCLRHCGHVRVDSSKVNNGDLELIFCSSKLEKLLLSPRRCPVKFGYTVLLPCISWPQS